MSKTEKILIIQTAFLGDLLLTIPLIKNLKKQYPNAELSLVCRSAFVSFIQKLNVVDHCFGIEKKNNQSYQKIVNQNVDYDLLICPHQSFTTALFSAKIKATRKVGFQTWWNFFAFKHRVRRNLKLPDALRQLSLLAAEDSSWIEKLKPFENLDQNYQSGELLKAVPEFADPQLVKESIQRQSIVLFPGSVWATKQWTESSFAELGKKLNKLGYQIEWLGSKEEKELCDRLAKTAGGVSKAGALSLTESFQRLAQAALAVCNDSGSQHMAALSGTPTVSIFGPTVLSFGYRPWNSKAIIVEKTGLSCRPCGKHGHQKCPIGTHACMKEISADEVFRACCQFL